MDPYDSDSSLEDQTEYSETNVNLGYASKEPTGDTISHLGGFPVCPTDVPSSRSILTFYRHG
jgi:hypothetical protein